HGCHGENGRPLWGAYNLWPGAFGGFDDRVLAYGEMGLEWRFFEKFVQSRDRGRYRFFPLPRVPQWAGKSYSDFISENVKNGDRLPDQPNINLTVHISGLNFKRIAAQL